MAAFIVALSLAPAVSAQTVFPQVGNRIDGVQVNEVSASTVAVDGDRVVIGSPESNVAGSRRGAVRVYDYDAGTDSWVQLGSSIFGDNDFASMGSGVAIEGDRLAVGAQGTGAGGVARVFEYNAGTNTWDQIGADLVGSAGDSFGASLALDGDRVAIGGSGMDVDATDSGGARVYDYNAGTNTWNQVGSVISGEAGNDYAGVTIALQGDRVALGSQFNDGLAGANSGHVRVHELVGGVWSPLGNDLDGENGNDYAGTSVAMDGDRVAVGAFNNGGGAGHVRVWELSGGTWAPIGGDIDGSAGAEAGRAVAIEGDRLVVGMPKADTGGTDRGLVRVLDLVGGVWTAAGADLLGDSDGETLGWSLALDGDRLIAGGPNDSELGNRHGVAKVYALATPSALSVASGAALYWPLDTAAISAAAVNADGVFGLAADLGYDASQMAYDANSLAAGELLASGSPILFQSDDGAGTLDFSVSRTDGIAASGDGSVADVTFSMVDFATPGTASFSLANVDAIDPAGDAFTFDEVTGGSFEVGGVWPGDLDNNCTVQALDLLALGLNYNQTGPARLGGRDFSWSAKAFSPWGGSSASGDFARSFADGDGNGRVNAADLLAIAVNFAETHDATTGCTPLPAPFAVTTDVTIPLDAAVGTVLAFDVSLAAPATDLLGLAMTLGYEGTGATVVGVVAGDLFDGALEYVKVGDTATEAAFTHAGTAAAVSGTGTLVRVLARVDAPGASLRLSDLYLSTASGGTQPVDPSSGAMAYSMATPVATDGGPDAGLDVSVAPNPARGVAHLALRLRAPGEVTVAIYDVLGRRVAESVVARAAGNAAVALPLADLAPGAYVVRVETASGVASRRLTVVR